ncbi:MAG: class I SAM-dependent methyltransferase [Pirellulaceae bacterium]|nr:class I SAM-dependent methyltransferase [Pirellulaceae bacterium]
MTIERVLEPEVMDSPEEARDYDRMDHSEVNRAFVDEFLAAIENPQDVLDLGTGTAQIPIELCRRSQACRVMAVDASVNMLDIARGNIDIAGLLERIQLQKDDAKAMGFSDGMFDAVISNSIIHHIPEPMQCLREAQRVTREGGLLFFRDLLRPDSQQALEHLVRTYTGNESEHAQKMFGESLHAALSLEEIGDLVQTLGFDRNTVTQNSDRHWTWIACK